MTTNKHDKTETTAKDRAARADDEVAAPAVPATSAEDDDERQDAAGDGEPRELTGELGETSADEAPAHELDLPDAVDAGEDPALSTEAAVDGQDFVARLADHATLVLGAEAAAADDVPDLAGREALVLGAPRSDPDALDAGDPLAEFAGYASLDDEYPEDDEDAAAAAAATAAEDAAALTSPKERRLADLRLEARIEAIVFAAQKPLKTAEIREVLADASLTDADVQTALDLLVEFYADRCGGFRLHYLKRLGYQFQTAESAGLIMERMFASRPRPISRAALETLSIIAYRQPVTRAEVEFIRGVDAGSIFKTLLERELIKCVGRKEIVGRPMLFGTSDNFLTVFNLSSIKDLPPLESFQPSRDVMQGALDKIADGDTLVDVEDYIADNTRPEYEGDDLAFDPESEDEGDLAAADAAEAARAGATADPAPLPSSSEVAVTAREDPAEAGVTDEPGERPLTGALADDVGTAPADDPATAPPSPSDPNAENVHGTDADSEVALPDGRGLPAGSGDLDR